MNDTTAHSTVQSEDNAGSPSQDPSQDSSTGRRLDRDREGRPAAPVRAVHLGVGNFFRAHQAWYTQRAAGVAEERWGIAAFTGRSAAIAQELAPAQGLYTLATKGPDGAGYETIDVLSAVHPADDLAAWCDYLASPQVAVVTSTVTEAGYRRAADGSLDLDDADVQADLGSLRDYRDEPDRARITTAPGRFVAGLLARRAAGVETGPAFVPCDNVPENGPMVRRVVLDLAERVDPELPSWIEQHVAFVTTMVDRITPRTTDADRAALRAERGIEDPAVVVTEPFAEWVLAGDFPGGRPAWEEAGARFVDDVAPFETRKLWLLNGSHSLMAYAATIVGHETVAEAIADERVRAWVEAWWDVAASQLTVQSEEIEAYRAALVERYENPNIRHLLAQIAADGSQKIPIRIVPALRAAQDAGADIAGATRAIAAWVLHLRGLGAPVVDAQVDRGRSLAGLGEVSLEEAVDRVLGELGLTGEGIERGVDTGIEAGAGERIRGLVLAQAQELEALAV